MSHERDHYQAIILDIDIPIMDGIEAYIKINNYLNEEEKEKRSEKRVRAKILWLRSSKLASKQYVSVSCFSFLFFSPYVCAQ